MLCSRPGEFGRRIDYMLQLAAKSEHPSRNGRANAVAQVVAAFNVQAPEGSSEFIDIDIPSARRYARYVSMTLFVYNGLSFAKHETCYAGWMSRAKPASYEVYEPATVAQKIDLTQPCRSVMPVVFDLAQRAIVWTDLPVSERGFYYNNAQSSRATLAQKLNAIVNAQN